MRCKIKFESGFPGALRELPKECAHGIQAVNSGVGVAAFGAEAV